MFQLSYLMSQYPYLVCPIEYSESLGMTMDCEPSGLFRLQEYTTPAFMLPLVRAVSDVITADHIIT